MQQPVSASMTLPSQTGEFKYTQDGGILSQAQRKFYEENGFLVIRNLVAKEQLKKYRYVLVPQRKVLNHCTNGLVQERRNSIANALELRLSCTNPSIRSKPFLCLSINLLFPTYFLSFLYSFSASISYQERQKLFRLFGIMFDVDPNGQWCQQPRIISISGKMSYHMVSLSLEPVRLLLKCPYHFEIWHAAQQQCCWGACKIGVIGKL